MLSRQATRANADILGVADRVELHTADVRNLPLPNGCADVVVSSLVLHNLPDAQARSAALGEAVRLLRPGGRLVLLDIAHVARYAEILTKAGLLEVHHRNAGWRYFVHRWDRASSRPRNRCEPYASISRPLRSGDLTPIRVPTPQEEAVRDLCRARADLLDDL